ncbi:divergent paired-related homeobox [Piliocolobus tephrosceles]|uniref:divergent paired-related homeobox n=1 Tax=Piliocolobus tephrosceles TaxID=591936 RepID=UPI000C2AFE96|nr:divergent paired-related homeobox [Piliocolobus tephrosceles]XP_026310951.1 divergent paired-related homeobox [Piliocolobus tephrosceles]
MPGSEDLRKGKDQMHSHRKRTMFTKKQLEDLNILFNENPYPNPSLQKEMASKIDIHPTVLQVWFKNHRAKLKKAKCKHIHQKQETPQPPAPQGGVTTRVSPRNADTLPRLPSAAHPIGLVYTGQRVPSFQLILYPNLKVPANDFAGHRIVHFGCCQDPNIYCLYPILESQVCAPSFHAGSSACSSLQSRER